ncbi:MAG: hypothetical protein V8T29_01385 [Oscillospiraceae bacterium]
MSETELERVAADGNRKAAQTVHRFLATIQVAITLSGFFWAAPLLQITFRSFCSEMACRYWGMTVPPRPPWTPFR